MESIKNHGQKNPIHISESGYIIDGYRRFDAMQRLGCSEVQAIVHPDEPSIYLKMILNQYRIKTSSDEVQEVKAYFKIFPKKQGKKKENGEKYSREHNLEVAVGYRWKGGDVLAKIETIIENDFDDNFLMKNIIENKFKVEPTYEFLKTWKEIDEKNKYGYTEKLRKGELTITDTNKLIQDRDFLEHEYQDTFVIPDKAKSLNIDCIELGNMEEFKKTVDTIFTSIPYFILRKYENGDQNQIGHEENKFEYCERIAKYFLALIPTLKDSANVMINIGETYDDGVGYGIPQLLKETIERVTGLKYKDTLIWSKSNPKPQNETIKRPINNVEYILWFVVDPKKAKYNLLTYSDGTKTPKISHGVKDVDKDGKVWNKNISLGKPYKKIYSHLKEQEILNIIEAKTGKNHDVYRICSEGHPSVMSPAISVIPILMTTNPGLGDGGGDVVFDPFSGSNVVGRMACLLNRKALSAELSKKYFKIGCKMLEEGVADFDRSSLDIIQNEFYHQSNENQLSIAA
jgi:DNA modification methylase